MIKWLICKLWGHKTISKAATGQTYQTESPFIGQTTGLLFRYEQSKFCLRCGTPNKKAD